MPRTHLQQANRPNTAGLETHCSGLRLRLVPPRSKASEKKKNSEGPSHRQFRCAWIQFGCQHSSAKERRRAIQRFDGLGRAHSVEQLVLVVRRLNQRTDELRNETIAWQCRCKRGMSGRQRSEKQRRCAPLRKSGCGPPAATGAPVSRLNASTSATPRRTKLACATQKLRCAPSDKRERDEPVPRTRASRVAVAPPHRAQSRAATLASRRRRARTRAAARRTCRQLPRHRAPPQRDSARGAPRARGAARCAGWFCAASQSRRRS